MKYSFIIPIRNRSNLLHHGLRSLSYMNYERKDFEIILVDQMSSDNLEKALSHYEGKLNIAHVKVDFSSKHDEIYLNNNHYNPGLAQNIGSKIAEGETLILTSPEIIHHSENLKNLDKIENIHQKFIYGNVIEKDIKEVLWDSECDYSKIDQIKPNSIHEMLCDWKNKGILTSVYYIGVISKFLFNLVRGIDEYYMGGIAWEDEDFGNRIVSVRNVVSECNYSVFGIHLKHDRSYLGSTNLEHNAYLKRNKEYLDVKERMGWDNHIITNKGKEYGDLSLVQNVRRYYAS